jgi:hypothetical protein
MLTDIGRAVYTFHIEDGLAGAIFSLEFGLQSSRSPKRRRAGSAEIFTYDNLK